MVLYVETCSNVKTTPRHSSFVTQTHSCMQNYAEMVYLGSYKPNYEQQYGKHKELFMKLGRIRKSNLWKI